MRKKNLEILFKLLESQNNKQFEVILIDSGSTDGTIEFLDKYNFKFPFKFTNIDKKEFSFGRSLKQSDNTVNIQRYYLLYFCTLFSSR